MIDKIAIIAELNQQNVKLNSEIRELKKTLHMSAAQVQHYIQETQAAWGCIKHHEKEYDKLAAKVLDVRKQLVSHCDLVKNPAPIICRLIQFINKLKLIQVQ